MVDSWIEQQVHWALIDVCQSFMDEHIRVLNITTSRVPAKDIILWKHLLICQVIHNKVNIRLQSILQISFCIGMNCTTMLFYIQSSQNQRYSSRNNLVTPYNGSLATTNLKTILEVRQI
jgi:hypothetical protein